MSFLRKISGCASFQSSRTSPIAQVLVGSAPNQLTPPADARQLTTSRVNWAATQQSRKHFHSSVPHLRQYSEPSPRVRRSQAKQPSQRYHDDEYQEQWEEPPPGSGSGTIVMSTIVGTCIGVYVYGVHLTTMDQVYHTKATREALDKFRRVFIHTLKSWDEGRYYTILTSAFMHSSLPHLGLNMLAIWGFGRLFISVYGLPSFLGLYFGSAIAGGVVQTYIWKRNRVPPETSEVGASGAALSLFMAMACAMPSGGMSMMFIPMTMWQGAVVSVIITAGGLQDMVSMIQSSLFIRHLFCDPQHCGSNPG
jgi:membrane associated rhomboid family serine protease